jgi:hypothetical protein
LWSVDFRKNRPRTPIFGFDGSVEAGVPPAIRSLLSGELQGGCMSDRNTIARELTVEELDRFIKELAALPGKQRTLQAIAGKAAALGINISLMSAKSFRDTTFQNYLDRLNRAQEKALSVRGMQEAGAGNTLADAAGAILSEAIFDSLTAEDPKDIDIEKYSLAIARMRQGDVKVRALEATLKEFERKEAERTEKKTALTKTLDKEQKRGGITPETRKLIDQELGAIA